METLKMASEVNYEIDEHFIEKATRIVNRDIPKGDVEISLYTEDSYAANEIAAKGIDGLIANRATIQKFISNLKDAGYNADCHDEKMDTISKGVVEGMVTISVTVPDKVIANTANSANIANSLGEDHYKHITQQRKRFESGEAIALVWTIDDVLDQAKGSDVESTLTKEDAIDILQKIARNHDATIGVSWDVIDAYIDELAIKKEQEAAATPATPSTPKIW